MHNDIPRPERLREALGKGPLLGDGANGTMLHKLGFDTTPYDLANVLAPELVVQIHRQYFDAGSDFVETNTFAAGAIRLSHTNWDVREINLAGARLAREAAGEDRFVLGAIGPAGKSLQPIGPLTPQEIRDAVTLQGQALIDGGVDGFILETFIDLDEIILSVDALRAISDLPIIVSKAFIEDGEALAEGVPTRVATELAKHGVDAVGANCVVGPQRMVDIVRQLSEACDLPILAFPTPGLPQLVKGAIVYGTEPEYFGKAGARLIEEGASIIGGCCGTTPEHIRFLREAVNRGVAKKAAAKPKSVSDKPKAPLETSEPTLLAQHLADGTFVVAVEMDLPRGLNVQKVIAGSAALKEKGANIIDISDGARARLRVNPLSVSKLIQDQVGIEVMMHFACRDRNLLAMQADLLGAHALGVKNILAVTGDPANIGDYPSATSVYDVDSIGLVRILGRFNEGLDLAGYSIGRKCAFTIAVAFNPLSEDMGTEADRLARKRAVGAHVIYTQPVFDRATVDLAVEHAQRNDMPIMIGVLPLRSARHAEFMHHEVPGIVIPDDLRARMAAAADDDDALKIGVEEAQKLAVYIREVAQGLYLMPPFGNHAIAAQVLESVQ